MFLYKKTNAIEIFVAKMLRYLKVDIPERCLYLFRFLHIFENIQKKYLAGIILIIQPLLLLWINPPFYLKFPFLEKAVYTYQKVHNDIYFLGPVSMLTAKKFHEIIEGIGIKLYIPNGRIKFRGIYQEREETPPFGCVIFKLQSQNEIKFFNIVVPGQHSILNETDL